MTDSDNRNGHSKNNPKRRPPKEPPAEADFRSLMQAGTQALQKGQVAIATNLLEQAYELDQENPDAALNLAGAYILSKKFKEAIAILEPLSERQPTNPMVWTNLGAAYLGNPVLASDQKQHRAIGAFKLAHALDPKTPHVAYNLGLIYRDRKEFDHALHWFKQALEADPKDQDARRYIKRLSEDPDSQIGDKKSGET